MFLRTILLLQLLRLFIASAKEEEEDCSLLKSLSQEDVLRSEVAVRLSEAVGDLYGLGDRVISTDNGVYYQSDIDALLVAKIETNYCAVAFRGTTSYQPSDWISNLEWKPFVFEETDCDLHEGYQTAYANLEETVQDFLVNCTQECPDCEILLTGHSQGGGIAQIAALHLQNLLPKDPYVITFGSVQSLGAQCDKQLVSDRCRWFRYVMARESTFFRKVVYDPIPLLYEHLLKNIRNETYARNGGLGFFGHSIVLNANDPFSAYSVGFDDHWSVDDLTSMDGSGQSHFDTLYTKVISSQAEWIQSNDNNNNKVLPTTGFSTGSLCNLEEGDLCGHDAMCQEEEAGLFLVWETRKSTCQPVTNLVQRPQRLEASSSSRKDHFWGIFHLVTVLVVVQHISAVVTA